MSTTEKFWDQQASTYDDTESRYEQIYIRLVANTIQHLAPGDIVMDYACGTGSIAIELADRVQAIHAIDISSGMINVAKRKAGERSIENIYFAQTTLLDERYVGESFDVILAFNILHLLENAPEVIQRIHELLKPGGLFMSATPCLGEKRSFFGMALPLLSKTGLVPYVRSFKIPDLDALIAQGHYSILETDIISQSPPSYFVVAKKST